ncbi:MAG: hypothetical protein ABUK01_06280 [Leptospirales bacterium]
MYLEAPTAKKLSETFFTDETLGLPGYEKEKWLVRRFLTSSRSFKRWVKNQSGITINFQKSILETELPKFIWIAEYSRSVDYRDEKSSAMLILDATGMDNQDALLFARYPDRYFVIDRTSGSLKLVKEYSDPMPLYKNNLKGEWNQWKSN